MMVANLFDYQWKYSGNMVIIVVQRVSLMGWQYKKWFVFEIDILLVKQKEAQIAQIKKKFSPLS